MCAPLLSSQTPFSSPRKQLAGQHLTNFENDAFSPGPAVSRFIWKCAQRACPQRMNSEIANCDISPNSNNSSTCFFSVKKSAALTSTSLSSQCCIASSFRAAFCSKVKLRTQMKRGFAKKVLKSKNGTYLFSVITFNFSLM